MRRMHSSGRRRFAETDTTATMLAERLAAVEQLVVAQQERIAQQQEEIAGLRAVMGAEMPAEHALIVPANAHGTRKAAVGVRSSRRSLLKMGGAAAAAGVAASALALTSGQSARAQGRAAMRPFTSNPWTTSSFTADAETVVAPLNGSYSANDILQVKFGTGSPYSALSSLKSAIAGYDTTGSNVGLYGTSSAGYGLFGVTDTGSGATGGGLNGTANSTGTGVVGVSNAGVGVSGTSASGIGGSFIGGQAPLLLGLGGPPGPPSGGNHNMGEVYGDGNADLWVCVNPGNPGDWVRLSHPAVGASGGAVSYLSAPIRLLDTRGGDSLAFIDTGGPYASGSTHTLPVAGVNWQSVQVPANAVGAIGKVTAVATPAGGGFIALLPSGTPFGGTANLPFSANAVVATSFNVGLAVSGPNVGELDIYIGGNATHVVIDLFAVVV